MKKPHINLHTVIWLFIVLFSLAIMSFIVIPPILNINKYKSHFENIITEQTGIETKINGDIRISLIGHPTIVANNITVPNGKIGKISFSIPTKYIFNVANATLNNNLEITNANLSITNLHPYNTSHNIHIYNSNIKFIDKDYKIIRGTLNNKNFSGQIRTNQHKYDIDFTNNEFTIKNNNNNLIITGLLYPDGTANGTLKIKTNKINEWFEFTEPEIKETIDLSMNFDWDGAYGFNFSEITANNFYGNIKLSPDGHKYIELKSTNVNYDLSFLKDTNKLFYNTDFNIDLYGNMKIDDKTEHHLLLIASGLGDKIKIEKIETDNLALSGGTITKQGLENTEITFFDYSEPTTCLFSGNIQNWKCEKYSYGDITGSIIVQNGKYEISASSRSQMPPLEKIQTIVSKFGKTGKIEFSFENQSGTIYITPKETKIEYTFAQNSTLQDLNIDLKFVPKFMLSSLGSYTLESNKKTFLPYDKKWTFSSQDKQFYITGDNIKDWFPNINFNYIRDLPYIISGTYNNDNIDNLNIIISGMVFSGSRNKNGFTLKTNELNINNLINSEYFDNFEQEKFLSNHPIATLFQIPTTISLSADKMIYKEKTYSNFVYSLKPSHQVFSISDNDLGNALLIIEKNKNEYDISLQLNKYKMQEPLLNYPSPLNITDSIITAEISLKTNGQTANDLLYNLSGDVDLTFEGGIISGFGFDKFYSNADNITGLNAEYAISDALERGDTRIKKIKINGFYDNGNFITSRPLTISMPHVDGVGKINIEDKQMSGIFTFVMRGTSTNPSNIELLISPNGARKYSLTEIMQNFDSGFMRAFIRTHDKF